MLLSIVCFFLSSCTMAMEIQSRGDSASLHEWSTLRHGRSRVNHHKYTVTAAAMESNQAQNLIICNAYTSSLPLHIYHRRLPLGKPLSYKSCEAYRLPLLHGDQLDFRSKEELVGTFFPFELRRANMSLLLIPHRGTLDRDNLTFDTHAFAELPNAQIAIVDASKYHTAGTVQIQQETQAHGRRMQHLHFNHVAALEPGKYQFTLHHMNRSSDAQSLHLRNGDKSVVLRVGDSQPSTAEDKTTQFPLELIIYKSPSYAAFLEYSGARPTPWTSASLFICWLFAQAAML